MFEYRRHSFVVKQTLWTYHHERIVIFFIMVVALGVIIIIIIINIIIIICLYCCYNNKFQASILPLEPLLVATAYCTPLTTQNGLVTNHSQGR